jgi:hypothetical protein
LKQPQVFNHRSILNKACAKVANSKSCISILIVIKILPWDSEWPKDVDGDLQVKYLYANVSCRYNINSRYTVLTFAPRFGVAKKKLLLAKVSLANELFACGSLDENILVRMLARR